MQNQKGNILVILLLLLAGAGLVFVGYKYAFPKLSKVTPTPTIVPTLDPMADWEKYTNEKYRFEFKYPHNLNYSEFGPNESQQVLEKGQQISGTVEPSLTSIIFQDGTTKFFRVDIFNTSLKKIAIGDYKDKYLYTNGLCDIRWGFEQIEETLFTISNLNVLKVSQKNPNYQSCYYFQIQNNKLLVLSTYPLEDSLKSEELTKNLNQILSTFQYYTDIPNWKTYTSKTYKYLVKYPADITPRNIDDDLSLEFVSWYFEDKNDFWFSIRVTQKKLEFENEVNNEKAKISHSLVKLISEKNLKIQGYKAIRLDYEPQKKDVEMATNTYIFIEKDMYIFTISSRTNTIDQILSTFQFTK